MVTVVGQRTPPADWEQRTSGRARYAGDLRPEGLLVGAVLRSPHPHAEIRSIDTAVAEKMPGVHAVVTHRDLPPDRRYLHVGPNFADRPPLAVDRVRYIGQEVAAVAATDAATARRAVSAIKVRYRPLPAPLTVEAALKANAPTLHMRAAGPNLAVDDEGSWGDPVAARRRSHVAVEGTFRYPRSIHVCMERSTTLATWHGDRVELWTTTQAPWYVAVEIAHALDIPVESVVVHDVAVGGGFGARSKIGEHEVLTVLLARKAGRPVRIELTREEEFASTKTRHRSTVTARTHATAEGRICLIEGDLLYENGAYNHSGPTVLKVGVKTMGSLYEPDAVTWRARLVDTALQPGGQFRGYGGPQMSLALESQVDEIAERLNIDPIDLRILNANPPQSTALCGARIGSARLPECLSAVREHLDWDRRRSIARSPGRGLGVAAGMHGSGSHVGPGTDLSSAVVEIDGEGGIRVLFGSLDTGTGQRTVCAQVAAEELGVQAAEVTVVMGHEPSIPHDAGAWSSRGTHMAGHAVGAAARALADQLRELASVKLGGRPQDIVLTGGRAVRDDDGVDLTDLVRSAEAAEHGVLRAEETYHEERMEMFGAENPTPNFSASYTFCAHGVEVEVDELTGSITVVDYVAAHDVGRAINPGATEGQIIGGVVMALGAVLGEELVHEGGRLVNPAILSYGVPRATDVADVRAVLVEGPEKAGPYDAKSVGELPMYPVAAAVANAVYDAIGVRLREPPFTPDKVLAAIADRDGRRLDVRPVWRRPSRWWVAGIRALYPRGLHELLHRFGTRLARRPRRGPVAEVDAPGTLEGLLDAVGASSGTAVGGNTDLSLQRRQGLSAPVRLVSTSEVAELRRVDRTDGGDLRIGASVTLEELGEHLAEDVPALADAARSIASPQIRAVATLGGNLLQAKRCWFFRNGFDCYKRSGPTCPCYAVDGDHRFQHAIVDGHRCQAVTPSDLATALLALDATVTLRGSAGQRVLTIDRLFTGPGETVIRPGEVLVSVVVPAAAVRKVSAFSKLALWEGDFAVVSAALSADVRGDDWFDVRLVLGAVAPTPLRLTRAECALEARGPSDEMIRQSVGDALWHVAHPLENNRWKLAGAEGIAVQAGRLLRSRSRT